MYNSKQWKNRASFTSERCASRVEGIAVEILDHRSIDFRPSCPDLFENRSSIHRNPMPARFTESAAEKTPSASCNETKRCCAVRKHLHFPTSRAGFKSQDHESRESQSKISALDIIDFRPSRPDLFENRCSIHRNPILARISESAAERVPSARCNETKRCCAGPKHRHFPTSTWGPRSVRREMLRLRKLNSLQAAVSPSLFFVRLGRKSTAQVESISANLAFKRPLRAFSRNPKRCATLRVPQACVVWHPLCRLRMDFIAMKLNLC